jgi:ATP-dependent DNA ligase
MLWPFGIYRLLTTLLDGGGQGHRCSNHKLILVSVTRRMVYERLKPLVTDKCPFVNLPETGCARWGEILDANMMKKCVWLRPKLVAVIEFLEWTEGDRLRHSKFVALREGKNPREVIKEL